MDQALAHLVGTYFAKGRLDLSSTYLTRCVGSLLALWSGLHKRLASLGGRVALASVLSGCAGIVAGPTPLAFEPPIDYPALVRMTRALQHDPAELIEKIVARRVQLALRPYPNFPERLHQSGRTDDMMNFICIDQAGFVGGPTNARIVRFEPGPEGAVTFWLSECGLQEP